MTEPVLQLRALTKSYGGLIVTDNVDLNVLPNEVHALIGPNGAGKSTLIAQIFGEITPDKGAVLWCGEEITRIPVHQRVRKGLARSFQVTSVLPEFTALDNVRLATLASASSNPSAFEVAAANLTATERAQTCLERVGLATRSNARAEALSYGERRHLELAMALALEPRLMLLDEPMAGVGSDESHSLTAVLRDLRQSCAILLVEHDMDVVFALADRVSVLVAGRIVASGSPAEVHEDHEVKRAYFGEEDVW
ncbi:ABC transporter ATP-binding protein [Microvirga alba]|uniref:ABC transporter ATP-binding protein n=1 Tax=Microvirga alba TaxID=2791025 RepID=A0A931BU95_9HYPH|nr:ABC transporter ATP-binding protein [Microvirga alba]MBF9234854.1 ABC transporter ATP-binding protein [Microvirga alba]